MLTLIRWILLKQKQIKWKLGFYQMIEKTIKELKKDPEILEKKFLPYLAKIIHDENNQNNNR